MMAGLTDFVDIVGKMQTQSSNMMTDAFAVGTATKQAILDDYDMSAKLATSDKTFLESLYQQDQAVFNRTKLGLTKDNDLQAEKIDSQSDLLKARTDLISRQYGLEAAPTDGKKKVVDSATALTKAEQLQLEGQRLKESTEKYSVIGTELDAFTFNEGVGTGGKYDPYAISALPAGMQVDLLEKAKTANLSSPAFMELSRQFDATARRAYDGIGHDMFKSIIKLSPNERAKLLKEKNLDEKSLSAVVDSLNRRGENLEINMTVPKMSDSPVMYDVTRSLGTDKGLSSQSGAPTPVPNHTQSTVSTDAVKPVEVKIAQPQQTTVVSTAKPIAPDRPIYQADANKIPVTAVVDLSGAITVYETNGNKRPFNAATDTVQPGKMMLSPEARQAVDTPFSEDTPESILTYADTVSELDIAVNSSLGNGSINGAYENSNASANIHRAISLKKEVSTKLKEADLPTSPKELSNLVEKVRTEFANKNPIRGFFNKLSYTPPVEDMLNDDKLVKVFEILKWEDNALFSKTPGTHTIVTRAEIERHRLGIEKINPWKLQQLQTQISKMLVNPAEFYKMVTQR